MVLRSPGSWISARPRVQRLGARGVVLQEVDGLADVAVGLRPRLAALAHGQRRELQPACAHQLGGAAQDRGALGGAAWRPTRAGPRPRGRSPRRRARRRPRAARATTRSGAPGRPRRTPRRGPARRRSHRDLQRQRGVERRERRQRLRAHLGAAQLQDRLVGEARLRSGRWRSWLLQQGREVDALGLGAQERVVAGVLQQAADEVGHPGHQVADRAIGAHAAAGGQQRGLRLVAQAAQDLQLDVGAARVGVGGGVGDRPQVVRGDRGADAAVGLRVDQAPRQRLVVAVARAAVLEDRRRPAVLDRLDGLVVPVGALDQADGERLRARVLARPGQQAVEVLRRLGQVGLQDDARATAPRRTPARSAAPASAR